METKTPGSLSRGKSTSTRRYKRLGPRRKPAQSYRNQLGASDQWLPAWGACPGSPDQCCLSCLLDAAPAVGLGWASSHSPLSLTVQALPFPRLPSSGAWTFVLYPSSPDSWTLQAKLGPKHPTHQEGKAQSMSGENMRKEKWGWESSRVRLDRVSRAAVRSVGYNGVGS